MRKKYLLAHISDTHFTKGSKHVSSAFFKGVQLINDLKPLVVIHTGDVTDEGLSHQYWFAKQELSRIQPPLIACVGNHDSRNVGYELFEKYIGPRDGIRVLGDVLLMWLDSSVPDLDIGHFTSTKLRLVRKWLSAYDDVTHKIVAFHHHLLPVPQTGRERHFTMNSGTMLKTLLDFGVDMVLTGHKHISNIYSVDEIILVSGGTMSSYKTRRGGSRMLNFVKIQADSISVYTIPLDEGFIKEINTFHDRKRSFLYQPAPLRARILHIAHTEVGESKHQATMLEKLFLLVRRIKPDIVVHSGGITAEGIDEQYYEAFEFMDDLKVPYVIVPGPNDLNWLGNNHFKNYFNKDRFSSIEEKNIDFIKIFTSMKESKNGHVGREQLQEVMEQALNSRINNPKKIIAGVMHHHVVPIVGVSQRQIIEDAGDVLKGIVDSPIQLVFTGHLRRFSVINVNDTIFVNAGAVASKYTRSKNHNSFNVIDLLENNLVIIKEGIVNTGITSTQAIYELGIKKINVIKPLHVTWDLKGV